jgi:AcrR family transcriptional regulator
VHDHARGKVVGTALTVLAKHGFDATSMEQIAEATGIPSEEIVATIGTKDAVVLNVARDMLADVVRVLTEFDPQKPVVEALLKAHASVLNDVIDGTGPITLEDMRHMGKAVASSPDLQKKVSAQRTDMLSDVLADHFATSMSDRQVQQGLKLWSAVLAATYLDVLDKQGRFDRQVDLETPQQLRDRLNRTYRILIGRPTDRT